MEKAAKSDNTSVSDKKPNNVSSHLWEKFKALEKRTNEVTQKSTEKRIKQLQQKVMDTVSKEFTSAEDKKALAKYDVKLVPETSLDKSAAESAAVDKSRAAASNTSAVDHLKDFLNINEHLQERDFSRPPPPTALENRINEAIKTGDFETAESLSDHLATREMSEKIVSAIEAKRFMEQQEVNVSSAKIKRKRKLNWGFEPKHRWETKGNM
ncbi:unnamed protein product [Candidula unifasciata]|uniref:Uncharacterized protein n=1 Tax=Candidula unifasciata TaxID=100452 RepID=A0A8S3YNP1_9EUPU|nr:unnamed protein product [Candidula unifasciata]